MTLKLPQRGDIWRDYRGHFLVLDEHDVTPWEQHNGYLCEISILDLENGKIETYWAISRERFRELSFVA